MRGAAASALYSLPPVETLAAMNNDQFLEALHGAVAFTVQAIEFAGAVYRLLIERCVCVRLDSALLREVVPRVASGSMSAEAAFAFMDRPALFRKIAGLPVVEQERLARGGTVDCVPAVGQPPVAMTISEVYGAGRIRTVIHAGTVLSVEAQMEQLAALARYGGGRGALAIPPTATVTAGPATDEDIEELAAHLDAAMRERNVSRPTPRWLAERVVAAKWRPVC